MGPTSRAHPTAGMHGELCLGRLASLLSGSSYPVALLATLMVCDGGPRATTLHSFHPLSMPNAQQNPDVPQIYAPSSSWRSVVGPDGQYPQAVWEGCLVRIHEP